MDVGYQNQSTAFTIGGDNVRINGHGNGTFDGNGDYWYQWISEQPNTSNYPGRPHAVTFSHLTNSVIRGLTFLRSQMWYVKSRRQLLTNISSSFTQRDLAGQCPSFTLTICCSTVSWLTTLVTGLKAVSFPIYE
jgi:hypothetical protein